MRRLITRGSLPLLAALFLMVPAFPGAAAADGAETNSGPTVVATVPPAVGVDGEEAEEPAEEQDLSALAAAGTTTPQCDDGSAEGIGGYTPSSGCAKTIFAIQRRGCTVAHSDTPSGPKDTLTVTCPAKRCFERDLVVKIYVPADLPLGPRLRNKLQQADFIDGRGWKVAQVELKQVVESDGTTVTSVVSTAKGAPTATAGAIGYTVTAGTPTNFKKSANRRGVSTVNFQLKLNSPFGAWQPATSIDLEIVTNGNGAPSAYSPAPGSGNNPAAGIWVSKRQRLC
jgi:hypothetical protein